MRASKRIAPIIICAVALFLQKPFLAAQEKKAELQRGVLADGTPFRTDAQGNQIIDYIAELETTIDSLHRRIYGLELDLESKVLLVSRLRSNNTESAIKPGSLQEKDLLIEQAKTNDDHSTADKEDLLRQLNNHKEKLKIVQNESAACLQKLSDRSVHKGTKHKASGHKDKTKLTHIKKSNSELKEELATLRSAYNKGIAGREAKIQSLQELISSKDREIEKLKGSKTLKIASSQKDEPKRKLFRYAGENESKTQSQPGTKRSQALEAAKGMLRTELNRLRGLVRTRSSLYTKYKSKTLAEKQSLQFKLSSLQSKRGFSIKQIEKALTSVNQMSQLAGLKKDISQIRNQVKDDIALINRAGKL